MILYIVILYLFILILAYFFQHKLIFFPGGSDENCSYAGFVNPEEVFVETKDGETIHGLFYRGHLPYVILYFHGNAGNLCSWQRVADDFTRLGYSFMIIDYRGYGKSSGSISEKGLYSDGNAAYNYLLSERGFPSDNIIFYGRSIGSGVATELALKNECRGLVLESAYTSLARLGVQKFPILLPALTLRFRFDNRKKMSLIKVPVLFIHGQTDTLIPVRHSESLFAVCNTKKKLVVVAHAGHNNVDQFSEYHEALAVSMPALMKLR